MLQQINRLNNPLWTARFFKTTDPVIETFDLRIQNDSATGHGKDDEHSWDFKMLHWWSRLYEYRWMTDVAKNFYAESDLSKIKVLDAACGDYHPSCFMLAALGFGSIVAQDLFDKHPLIERFPSKNLVYLQGNLLDNFPAEEFDCINFISTLEHIEPENQPMALQNLCNRLKPGGIIIMTFDIPGYEFVTNLSAYKKILDDNFVFYKEEAISEEELLSSLNSVGPVTDGWKLDHKHINKLFCYRLLGIKQFSN